VDATNREKFDDGWSLSRPTSVQVAACGKLVHSKYITSELPFIESRLHLYTTHVACITVSYTFSEATSANGQLVAAGGC